MFNSHIGIVEVHGFEEVDTIDVSKYQNIRPEDMTNLYDAIYNAVESTLKYAKVLIEQDINVNGCIYVLTDGCDNNSKITPSVIKDLLRDSTIKESLNSLLTVLIQLVDPQSGYYNEVKNELEKFKNGTGITQFIDVGNLNEKNLAKLTGFISQSISSNSKTIQSGQSQVLKF